MFNLGVPKLGREPKFTLSQWREATTRRDVEADSLRSIGRRHCVSAATISGHGYDRTTNRGNSAEGLRRDRRYYLGAQRFGTLGFGNSMRSRSGRFTFGCLFRDQ